jgi:hypothetical protein
MQGQSQQRQKAGGLKSSIEKSMNQRTRREHTFMYRAEGPISSARGRLRWHAIVWKEVVVLGKWCEFRDLYVVPSRDAVADCNRRTASQPTDQTDPFEM